VAYFALMNSINRKIQERGMKISELERRAGLARTTISKLLQNNNTNPTLDTLASIAKVFECNISELLDEQAKEKSIDYNSEENSEKLTESRFEKLSKNLPWNNQLFATITNETCDYLKKIDKDPTFENILNTIMEIYNYCVIKNDGKFDSRFQEWYVQEHL